MNSLLSSRQRKALQKIRSECDYEDGTKGGTDNFILIYALAPGVGDKTISSLLDMKLIETGPHRWSNKTGFRITAAGRKAIE